MAEDVSALTQVKLFSYNAPLRARTDRPLGLTDGISFTIGPSGSIWSANEGCGDSSRARLCRNEPVFTTRVSGSRELLFVLPALRKEAATDMSDLNVWVC